MAMISFKFRADKFSEFWLKYEVELGIEDVIIAFKKAKNVLDIIIAIGKVADALKATEGFALKFMQDEAFREELAESIDGWLEFGGVIGATVVEGFDKKLIRQILDLAATETEVVE
jgi:hypothetical protein